MTLADAVARWLALNPAWRGRQPGLHHAAGLREVAQIWVGPPPTLSNQPPPQELNQLLHIARKFDVAGRDERNRALFGSLVGDNQDFAVILVDEACWGRNIEEIKGLAIEAPPHFGISGMRSSNRPDAQGADFADVITSRQRLTTALVTQAQPMMKIDIR